MLVWGGRGGIPPQGQRRDFPPIPIYVAGDPCQSMGKALLMFSPMGGLHFKSVLQDRVLGKGKHGGFPCSSKNFHLKNTLLSESPRLLPAQHPFPLPDLEIGRYFFLSVSERGCLSWTLGLVWNADLDSQCFYYSCPWRLLQG